MASDTIIYVHVCQLIFIAKKLIKKSVCKIYISSFVHEFLVYQLGTLINTFSKSFVFVKHKMLELKSML